MNAVIDVLPSVIIALLIRSLSKHFLVAWFLMLPGVLAHELWHWIAGVITAGKPFNLSLWPRKEGKSYVLGSVSFRNITWFNGVFIGLAPVMNLLSFYLLASNVHLFDELSILELIALWYLMACLLLSSVPSPADYKVALSSWPLIPLIAIAFLFFDFSWHW